MDSPNVMFWIFHGGSFRKTVNLVYEEGECTTLHLDPSNLTLEGITKEIMKLGYSEDRIKTIYYSHEDVPFHDSLVPVDDNDNFKQLVEVSTRDCRVVRLYVDTEGLPLEVDSDPEDLDYVPSDDEFIQFDSESDYESNSDADDDDVRQARKTMKEMKSRMTRVNEEGQVEMIDLFDPGENDSDDADSPVEDSDEEHPTVEGEPKYRLRKRVGMFKHKGEVDIAVGAQFLDKDHLRRALDNYRIVKGYSIKVRRSNKKRMQAVCLGSGCEWTCWSSPLGKELTWVVKSITNPHSCIPFTYQHGKRHMTSDWLSEKYMDLFEDFPNVKVREFRLKAQKDLDMGLTHAICSEARRKAVMKIVGDFRTQFGQLRAYSHELLTQNPGSTVKIKSNLNAKGEAVFRGIYICIDTLKQGFLDGCRRIVSLDGCFLKGPWDGQLLAAVGRDANNQMYPIAWGVVESETTESWRWFIELLQTDIGIGNGEGWTIISDQQKGLINAVNFFLPNVEHRMCARHVYANIRKWWRGLQYRNIFWKLAKSSNVPHFNKYKALFQNLSSEAWEFVEKKDPTHFCRLYFNPMAKCDSVDNNMAEVFNATIVEARFKPIITMLDMIYTQTMTRIARRYKWAEKMEKPITPRILSKLAIRQQKSNFWSAHEAGNGLWSVRHGLEGFVVTLAENTCSCGSWQLSGIPCTHAIAVFRDNGVDPHTCVHDCYATEYLLATYKHHLTPINGIDMWTEPTDGGAPIVAPFFKLKRKGLRTKRIPEVGEVVPTGRVSRVGGSKHCSRCKKPGHNKKGCKEVVDVHGLPIDPTVHQSDPTVPDPIPEADPTVHQSDPTVPDPIPEADPTTEADPIHEADPTVPDPTPHQSPHQSEPEQVEGNLFIGEDDFFEIIDKEIEVQRNIMMKYPMNENEIPNEQVLVCNLDKEIEAQRTLMMKYPINENEIPTEHVLEILHDIPTQESQTVPVKKGAAKWKLRKSTIPGLSPQKRRTPFTMTPKIPVRRKESCTNIEAAPTLKKRKASSSQAASSSTKKETATSVPTKPKSTRKAKSLPTAKGS